MMVLQWLQGRDLADSAVSSTGPYFIVTNNMDILVFKTNLSNRESVSDISSSLDAHPHIENWNVDLHDCDNVLRIVSPNINPAEIERLVMNAGYYCKELE